MTPFDSWLLLVLTRVLVILSIAWFAAWVSIKQHPHWQVWIWRTTSLGVIGTVVLSPHPGFIHIHWPSTALKHQPSISKTTVQVNERLSPGDVIRSQTVQPNMRNSKLTEGLQNYSGESSTPSVSAPVVANTSDLRAVDFTSERHWFDLLVSNCRPIVLFIWALGVCFFVAKLLWSWLFCMNQIRRSVISEAWIQERANELAARLGCRSIHVYRNDDVGSPALIGVCRPRIVIPSSLATEHCSQELDAAIAHELSHYAHRDLLWQNIIEVLYVLLWPLPWIWFVPSAHRYACELLSDETAANALSNRESYRSSLAKIALQVLTRSRASFGISMVSTPEIHRRLQFLSKVPSSYPSRWKLRVVALLACLLVFGISTVGIGRPPIATPFTSQPPSQPNSDPVNKDTSELPGEQSNESTPTQPNRIYRGRVIDEKGEPIEGATIRIFKAFDPFPARAVREITKTTNSMGVWEWDLGELPTVVALRVTHPNYIQREISLPKFSGESLESQLKFAKTIRGRIVDESKQPVVDATIHAVSNGMSDGMMFTDRASSVSKSDGTFVISGVQGNTLSLHAIAPDGRTAYISNFPVTPDQPYTLFANPASKIEFRVRNRSDEAISEAKIEVRKWADSRHIQWNSETDGSGNASWLTAPTGRLVFCVVHPDYSTKWHVIEPPFDGVQRIVLDPPHKLDATVLDKLTGKPIERFEAFLRYKRLIDEMGPRESLPDSTTEIGNSQFNRPVTLEGTDGKLSFISDLDFSEFELEVKAQGYLPMQLKIAKGDKDFLSELRMEPTAITNLAVLCPDGSPATGACVSIVKQNFIKFSEEEFDRALQAKNQYDTTVRVRTDENGRFEPTWGKDDYALMIHHPSGYYVGPAVTARSLQKVQLSPWMTMRFTGVKSEVAQSGTLELQYQFFPMSPFYFQVPVQYDPTTEEVIATEAPASFYGALTNIVTNGNTGFHHRLVNFISTDVSEVKREHVIIASGNSSVRGKLVFSGPGDSSRMPQIRIHSVSEVAQLSRTVDVQSDGSFEIHDLPAGQYAFENQLTTKETLFERNQIGPRSSRYYVLNDPDFGFKINENESLDLGTVACERRIIDANPQPRKFEPKFEEINDTFQSNKRVRFVVRSGRPSWQRFGTSHTEKIQFLDNELQPIREFGFETTKGIFGRNRRSNDSSVMVVAYNNELVFFDPFGRKTGVLQNAMPPSLAGTVFERLVLVGPRSLNKGPADLSLFDVKENAVKPFSGVRMSMAADSPRESGVWGYTNGMISKFDLSGKEVHSVTFDDTRLQPRELSTDMNNEGCWLTLYNPEAWGESTGWVVRVTDGKPPIITELGKQLPLHTEVINGDAYILGSVNQNPFLSLSQWEIVRVNSEGKVNGRWHVNCRDMCVDPEGRGMWLALPDQLALVNFEDDAMRVLETKDVAGVHGVLVLPMNATTER